MYCHNCGKQISSDVKECPSCGTLIIMSSERKKKAKKLYVSSKNRVVAILLTCLGFFGLAGLQRIYVCRPISGLLYALTCGGCFVGTVYDLYSLLCESFKDGDGFLLFSDSSMKPNYYRRTPKGSTLLKKLMWFCFTLFSFLFSLIILYGFYLESKPIDERHKTEILKLVEQIKENYNNEAYIESEKFMSELRTKYPSSRYIAMLEHDYPDIEKKKEAAEEIAREKASQKAAMQGVALKKYIEFMSTGEVSHFFAGAREGYISGTLHVFVNNNWRYLDTDAKIVLVSYIANQAILHGLDVSPIQIMHYASNRKLARWTKTFGVTLE